LGLAVVRMDSHVGVGPHSPGPFSLPREILAVVLVGAALAALAVVKARWPDADVMALWAIAGIAGMLVFFAVPLQALAIVYAAGILAATSRRSPVADASLAIGAIAGLAASLTTSLAYYALATPNDRYVSLILLSTLGIVFLFGGLAGAMAGRRLPDTGDLEELRNARARQGLLAGSFAGAVCGLVLTNFFVIAVFVMIIGPLLGVIAGAIGGLVVADHPSRSRPAHSWATGLFVRF